MSGLVSGFQGSIVLIALLGAVAYGSGDFMGGRAARRLSAPGAVAVAQCAAMAVAALLFLGDGAEVPARHVLLPCILGGAAYAFGLLLLYHGIAYGRVGVVAPVCGVVAILVPLAGDLALGRPIGTAQFLGIGLCAVAIVLLARASEPARPDRPRNFSLHIGAASGLGYGVADLLLGMMPPEESAGALVTARSVAALVAVALLLGARGRASGRAPLQLVPAAALAGLAGVFDALGHMSYVHAATRGSMAVAAALVALFPVVAVLLAIVLLRERLVGAQFLGLGTGVVGVVLIAL